jgi:hypothetical protein
MTCTCLPLAAKRPTTALPRLLAAEPRALAFGRVPVGASAERRVTVHNASPVELAVSAESLPCLTAASVPGVL